MIHAIHTYASRPASRPASRLIEARARGNIKELQIEEKPFTRSRPNVMLIRVSIHKSDGNKSRGKEKKEKEKCRYTITGCRRVGAP